MVFRVMGSAKTMTRRSKPSFISSPITSSMSWSLWVSSSAMCLAFTWVTLVSSVLSGMKGLRLVILTFRFGDPEFSTAVAPSYFSVFEASLTRGRAGCSVKT